MLTQLLAAVLGVSLLIMPGLTGRGQPEALLAQLGWLTATLGLGLVAAEAVVGARGIIGLYAALAGTAVMLLSLLPGSRRHAFAGGWRSLF
jgi:hypothetical protein